MSEVLSAVEPQSFAFADDGSIPNNPRLPFLFYRRAVDLKGTAEPERAVERAFAQNGWGDLWRNGIYAYSHYHSSVHEAMSIARGRARVRFGGKFGEEFSLETGDLVVLPAGTGHQGIWASSDLLVVGAFAPGGRFDTCRGSKGEHARALGAIPGVPLPATDPVFGANGPLVRLWRT